MVYTKPSPVAVAYDLAECALTMTGARLYRSAQWRPTAAAEGGAAQPG